VLGAAVVLCAAACVFLAVVVGRPGHGAGESVRGVLAALAGVVAAVATIRPLLAQTVFSGPRPCLPVPAAFAEPVRMGR
jgi:hypothetical protein